VYYILDTGTSPGLIVAACDDNGMADLGALAVAYARQVGREVYLVAAVAIVSSGATVAQLELDGPGAPGESGLPGPLPPVGHAGEDGASVWLGVGLLPERE